MSYSFSVRADTKAEAKEKVAAAFDEVVKQQPIHCRDREAALSNANAAIDMLVDDDAYRISVSLSGYLSWRGVLSNDDTGNPLVAASVSASASLVSPDAA